ncbi:Leukocyte immunoglobulin-like receptor subfamily A member 6 [Vulpes lagopus]
MKGGTASKRPHPGIECGLQDLSIDRGTLPKPTIWTKPGSVILLKTPAAICCKGSLKAQECRLHKEGHSGTWDRQKALESKDKDKDKDKFSITYMTGVYAGRYHCYYESTTDWSEPSDPLELVVTVLTLQYLSDVQYDRFALSKEGHVTFFSIMAGSFRFLQVEEEEGLGDSRSHEEEECKQRQGLRKVQHPLETPALYPQCPAQQLGPDWYLYILTGALVASVLLFCLVILLLDRQPQSNKHKMPVEHTG